MIDRAISIRHWLIAASQGSVNAVDTIKKVMTDGFATRDHYNQALRGYQLYMDEVRSDQRDRAAAYSDKYKYLIDAEEGQPKKENCQKLCETLQHGHTIQFVFQWKIKIALDVLGLYGRY
jgi:hypothetical protein